MDAEDSALLADVCTGSERAFNMLMDRHQQALRIFLRGLIASRDDADDIAQETFLVLWMQAKSFKGQSSVKSWLFSIAWRKAKDSQRSWFRRGRRAAAYHELTSSDSDRHIGVEDRHALQQALASLSLEQKAAVMLCLGYGASHSEAAEVLGSPLGTVKSHVARGREKLREILGEP